MTVPGIEIEPAGANRLAARGELSFATAAQALQAGRELLAAGRAWTVDLGGVTAGDSAGVAVLVEWLSEARARGASVAYEAVPSQMLAIARISELDSLLLAEPA